MNTPHIYSILIIAGDYRVVNCFRQALPKSRFQLHFAYTHRDAFFTLESQTFDGVVIDARMIDRHSHEWTLETIYNHFPKYRYVAYTPNDAQIAHITPLTSTILTKLDPRQAMKRIAEIFSLPEGLGDTLSLLPQDVTLDQHLARKIEELNTLFALSRSLTQSLDLSEVLHRVVESAQYLTFADEAYILLTENNQLYLRAQTPITSNLISASYLATQNKVALDVLNTAQPILIDEDNAHLYDVSGSSRALYVPIIFNESVNGVLGVRNVENNQSFNNNHTHLLMNLATFAAIAIENARIHQDLEQSLNNLKSAQTRLVHTARLSAMGELASVVAHQMNNPLTTIIAETELMLADEPQTSPRYSGLQAIARTGKRAANVARRLLAIARPIDINAQPDLIDVVDSWRGVLSLLQPHIEYRGIQLVTNFPPHRIPPVRAVKGQLEDIWINLLMNAYDALYGTSNATIGVEIQHIPLVHQVEIVVWDNGPGISSEIQEKIFSPFFTTKPVGEGTGLGLHICREVVANLGGTIDVKSQPADTTKFIIHLPNENAISSNSDYKQA